MNLRQLINLIEAEPSVQGTAAGYAPAQSTSPAADDTDTGGAAKPAPGIAAGSPAITGKAPADNMKNAGDVMRTAQGATDTFGASGMASAPSAAPTTDTRGAAAMASRSATPTTAPTTAVSPSPAATDTRGAAAMASRSAATTAPTTAVSPSPAATDTRGAAAMASRPTSTSTSTAPAMDQFSQNIAMANRNSGGAAKPAQTAEPAAPADTYSTEKGLLGGDITVRTDAQGRKFVPNPQKQGAMAYLNRGAPDEVAYRSADDIKQGVSNLADRFKSFFGGSKAPDTRGGAAMASRSAPQPVTKEDTDMSELRRLSGLPLNEKAASKQQQKFMGMVHAMQKGEKVKGASKELKKAAKGMSKKDAKDFASTKHKDLPNKVTESVMLEAGNTIDHILNRFKHETKNFLQGQEIASELYDALYDYYRDSSEMPYSVSKAPTDETYQWIEQRLENELDAMGYQRQTESSHALSELARLAGLSEAGPGRKAPAPNYRAIARRRMANMPPSTGTQDLGDVGPGEITPLDLSRADKSSTEQFPPSSKFSDMTADEVIAQTKTGATLGGSAKPTPATPAQPKSNWMSQDLARQKDEIESELDLMKIKEADELNQMRRIAGLKECDMGMDQQDSMNVSTNMSSDGTKSVSISAQGDKADALLQMLKMAGMRAHDDHDHEEAVEPIAIISTDSDEMLDESGMRLYHKLHSDDGTIMAKVYKDPEWNEYVVKYTKMGQLLPPDTWYHTDDMEDAVNTAHKEIEFMQQRGNDEMMEDSGGVQVHDLSGMSGRELYDETQTNDAIHDGDVLVTNTGVGIMVEAWPVIVAGDIEGFHKLKDGTSWDEFEGGMYAESARKAMEVSGQELDEERVTHYANTPDEEYETVAAITRQGNDLNREKKQFSTDRGRDNPMAFELEESLADMLESIKVQEGGNAGGIDAEQPYKDPKTGKMVTPPKGATMPPPDSQYPPGDKRNMMPSPTRKK